jgi:rubrerythrin
VRPKLTSSGSRSADRFRLSDQPSPDEASAVVFERSSRRVVLVRAFAALGAAGLGGAALESLAGAAAGPSRAQDVRILNYLLRLEYLQEAFYKEAHAEGALSGELRRFAQVVSAHEAEHVGALLAVLGGDARSKPDFRFGDAVKSQDRFAAAALTLEETAAAGYIGQAANLTEKTISAVARIVAVEARHAAWIRNVVGRLPAPQAFDPAKTAAQVAKTLERTGFVGRS